MNKFIITALTALVLTFGVSISHAQAACVVTGFSASPTTVAYGGSSMLGWASSGCDTVSITPAQYPDNRPPSGSVSSGPLAQTTTFTIVGHTVSGSVSAPRSVTITVTGITPTPTPTAACKPLSFTAQEYTIPTGGSTTLHWDTQNCQKVAIHPADYPGDRPPYGTINTGAIHYDIEYSLTAYDANGNIGGQRFLTIHVTGSNNNTNDECRIDSFTADDTSIEDGDSTDLNWRTTDCDYVNITSDDRDFNNQDADDSVSVSPNEDTTYTLHAFPGNVTRTVRISVDDNNDQCSVDSFSASPTSIDRGRTSTLRWNTSGDVDYVTISGLSGNRSGDSSVSVSPYNTTTYTLRAYCNNGNSRTDSTTVYVNDQDENSAPQAITTIANVINGTQARLNGIAVPHTTTSSTRAWFEWGVGGSYPNRTNSQTVSLGVNSYPYSDLLSGLTPGVTYTYRAVVQNTYGTAYGTPISFRTSTPPVPQPVVRTQTVRNVVVAQSAASLLELRVESNYDRMCINGLIDYTITYRNLSSQTLEKSVLQFVNPQEITYLTASRGNYDVVNRTMTIDLGNIAPGEQGIITVHARVNDTAIRGNLTVATASVVYTNTKTRAQEDATAYSLLTVSDDCPNNLGASTFGFGSFLPNTLLGWLLLILVILALIVLARQFQKKPSA